MSSLIDHEYACAAGFVRSVGRAEHAAKSSYLSVRSRIYLLLIELGINGLRLSKLEDRLSGDELLPDPNPGLLRWFLRAVTRSLSFFCSMY